MTLSGSTVAWAAALARVALVVVWTIGQLAAVGAVALAISAVTEHPLVVLAAVLGGLIVFGVLSAIPALDWLQPYLLTTGWRAGADALRDPLPLGRPDRAAACARWCYLLIGGGAHRSTGCSAGTPEPPRSGRMPACPNCFPTTPSRLP